MDKVLMFAPYSREEIKALIKESVSEMLLAKVNSSNKGGKGVGEYERLTRREAMAFLKVGSTKFNEIRREGVIHPQRDGRTYYDKQELIDYCNSLKCKGGGL